MRFQFIHLLKQLNALQYVVSVFCLRFCCIVRVKIDDNVYLAKVKTNYYVEHRKSSTKKILNNLKITIKIKAKKRIFFDLKTHRLCELQC